MNDQRPTNWNALGWMFLSGQLSSVLGAVVGLIGLVWNFWAVLFGLAICSSGIALATYSRGRLERNFHIEHTDAKCAAIARFTARVRWVARISIAIAVVCVVFMFLGSAHRLSEMWFVYGLVGSVLLYIAAIIVGSTYVAWNEFFRAKERKHT